MIFASAVDALLAREQTALLSVADHAEPSLRLRRTSRTIARTPNPHQATSRLFTFAGLEHDPSLIQTVTDATRFRPQQGTAAHEFCRKGIVGDWKNHFDETDLKLYQEMAGAVAHRLGYAA